MSGVKEYEVNLTDKMYRVQAGLEPVMLFYDADPVTTL